MVKKGVSYFISSLLLVNAAYCMGLDESQDSSSSPRVYPSIAGPSNGPSCSYDSSEPTSVGTLRQDYTSAFPDLLQALKISYQNGSLYLFDTESQILTIHNLNSSETNQPDSLDFSEDVTRVYPLSHQRGFLFKIGKKKKRKLCTVDLNTGTIEFLARKAHKSHKLSYIYSDPDILEEESAAKGCVEW